MQKLLEKYKKTKQQLKMYKSGEHEVIPGNVQQEGKVNDKF